MEENSTPNGDAPLSTRATLRDLLVEMKQRDRRCKKTWGG